MKTRPELPFYLRVLLAVTLLGTALPLPVTAADPGYALSFDGTNDLVELALTDIMMAPTWPTTKTVSLWVKPTGSSGVCNPNQTDSCDAIFGDRPRYWGISRGVYNGADRLWVRNWDGNLDVIGIEYTPGVWVHIALVHSDGILRAYKNGVEVGSVASGATMQPQPPVVRTLYVGGIIKDAAHNWSFEGSVDEVQLWNVARSAAEIQQDRKSVLVGDEPGLAAYYRMSDGAGLILTDDSIHDWNGALLDGFRDVPPNGAPPQWVQSNAFPPDAVDDAATTAEDTAVAVSVLANDSDPDGDPLTVIATGLAAHGTANTDGVTVTYTPNPNFFGADSFPYTISDGDGGIAIAQVTITVTPVNDDPPVAVDDAATTVEDEAVIVPVLANDSDPDGDALTVTAVGPAAHGTATTDGITVTYTPVPDFQGADSFAYTISDGTGRTATAQVSITVTKPLFNLYLPFVFRG